MITDFDPRFNNSKPLWFEKLYQPFLPNNLRSRCACARPSYYYLCFINACVMIQPPSPG